MKCTQTNTRKRRAYQLKYRVIPRDDEEIRRHQEILKRLLKKKRMDNNELLNLEAEFNEPITKNTFIETLKENSQLGKPKGIRIPKSIGGSGK